MGLKRRKKYMSLIENTIHDKAPIRAFQYKVQSNKFIAKELEPVELESKFPLVQDQLYDIEQPG